MLAVAVGAPFDIELGAGTSAGYTWEPQSLPEGLELLGSDFTHAPDAAIGDGATQVFRMRATHSGRFRLVFVLKRRWESQGIAERLVDIEAT